VSRKNHTLRGIFQFFGVLTVLVSVAALAQVTRADRSSGKAHAVFVPHDASDVERVARRSVQTNGLSGGSLDATAPVFLPAVNYDSGDTYSYFVAAADVNGDKKVDLVVGNGGGGLGTVGVLLGNGDGTFQLAVTYEPGGNQPSGVAIADVNDDGKPDIVVTNSYYSNTVGVLLGNGDGSFQPVVTYDSGGEPWRVAVLDLNGDGKLDLVVANATSCTGCTDGSKVGVLLGNGDGTFQPVVTYGAGGFGDNATVALAVADANGDGRLDVVVANICGDSACTTKGSVGIMLGNGDGTFQPVATYGSAAGYSIAVADVNGDGKLDVLVSSGYGIYPLPLGSVGVMLGNGDGTFQAPTYVSSGGYGPSAIAVADVDGDGKPDLLVANFCASSSNGNCLPTAAGSVSILRGNGDGTFQAPVTYGSGGYWISDFIAVADVNGDGKPDMLAVNLAGYSSGDGSIGVLLNNTPFPDTTPPVITLAATPKVLWPPNGKMVPVTISGTITDAGSGVNASSAKFAVHDEYHLVQPHGTIALDPAGNYSFTILLQASRKGDDHDGRRYTIRVSAIDNAGNRGVKQTSVTVPHRRPHRKGEDD
jgi:FG-GAP-like repeat